MNILNYIIANKQKEVAEAKDHKAVSLLEGSPLFTRDVLKLTEYLSDPLKTGIIAEFKRMSPSKGVINDTADPGKVINGYSMKGASGVSVLTDTKFFGGKNSDLSGSRSVCSVPMLRKDFIIDEYQVVEARSSGADVILLIAAVLDEDKALSLARFAHSLDLQVLMEIHSKSEFSRINEYVDIVGVNNRDLNSFLVNINVSFELADILPSRMVKISESGISTPEKVKMLRKAGYQGFLMGEIFMKEVNPVAAFADFINKTRSDNVKD
jgi:indole-3-glycerol phosphate synthase